MLLYDSRFQDFPCKLQTRWLGPYEIQEVHSNVTINITTIDGFGSSFQVNGHRVHLYHKPLTKESFFQHVCNDPTMKILVEGSNDLATLIS